MYIDLELITGILIKSLYVGIVVITAIIIYKIILRLINRLLKKRFFSDFVLSIIKRIFRYLMFITVFIVSLQVIGVNVMSLWAITSAIIAAVAIGFVAFWSVVSNSFCTLLLLVIRPFRIGDIIEIFELGSSDKTLKGIVININMVFTSIEERPGRKRKGVESSTIIKVPNNYFFQKIIRVYRSEESYDLEEQIIMEKSLIADN